MTSDDPAADLRARDLLLDALTVSSGAVDAISFLALGKVFTAFMTGNVAFLGMRLAGAPGPVVTSVLASMAGFVVGVYVATRIVRPSAGAGVWPRRVTLALAISLIAHAGFLAVWFASGGQPLIEATNVLLALWAIAMGIQSAAVRAFRVEGVFTTAATGAVIILAADLAKWPATGAERRRMAGVLVSLIVGATAGSFLLVHARIYAPLLPVVIAAATVGTAAILSRERRAAAANQRRPGVGTAAVLVVLAAGAPATAAAQYRSAAPSSNRTAVVCGRVRTTRGAMFHFTLPTERTAASPSVTSPSVA